MSERASFDPRARAVPTSAVLAIYAARALLALVLAWPIAKLFSDPVLSFRRGDRLLFEDGALFLSEIARLYRSEITSLAEGAVAASLLAAYLGLIPLGALISAMSSSSRPGWRVHIGRALEALGALSFLLGCSLVLSATAWAVPSAVFAVLEDKLRPTMGEVGMDLLQAASRGLSLLGIAMVAIVQDLARIVAVRDGCGALLAAIQGLRAFRGRWPRAMVGWSVRGAGGLALIAVATLTASRMGVETSGRFAVVLLTHQLVVFALLYLRADWLAHARSLVPAADGADRARRDP